MELIAKRRDGSTIRYTDSKRYLWPVSMLIPVITLLVIWLYSQLPQYPIILLLPLVYTYALIPVLDWLIGSDTDNPPEEVVPELSEDFYYSMVAYTLIPAHMLLFLAAAWLVGTHAIPWWAWIAFTLSIGNINGNTINIGHELGHKTDWLNRFMAKMALAVSGYGHFTIEHNRGHHVMVSTPEDCASARMGESVYAFAMRELPGAFTGGWQQEARRLKAKGHARFSWRNEILQVYAATFLIAALLVAWLGWVVVPFIILHHAFAWYALTMVNYIEHYGLLRQKKENGRYEQVEPRHSWNTNHLVSNLMLLHLQRHSDHHANPMRPYQSLRDYEDVPNLPSGYPGSMLLASIPPLWFKVMDPRVMDWAGGDIDKVNITPQMKKHYLASGRIQT